MSRKLENGITSKTDLSQNLGMIKKCSVVKICNAVSFALNFFVTLTVESFARSSNEIAHSHETLITPAEWAFAIWGVIFSFEAVFTIWQLFKPPDNVWLKEAVGWWWILACTFQTMWCFAFAKDLMWLSAVLLAGIAVSLAILCTRLSIVKFRSPAAKPTFSERLLIHFSFGVHAGWTAAATLLNFNLALVAMGISPESQLVVAALSLLLILFAGLWFSFAGKNMGYSLALSWAFFGIAMNQEHTSDLLGDDLAKAMRILAAALSLLFLLSSLACFLPYSEGRFFGKLKDPPLLQAHADDTKAPDLNSLFDS